MGALANCLGVLLLCFVVSSCSFDNDDCLPSSLESSKLKMVIVITRHGDRTPLTFFPNTKSEWPEVQTHQKNLRIVCLLKQKHRKGGS